MIPQTWRQHFVVERLQARIYSANFGSLDWEGEQTVAQEGSSEKTDRLVRLKLTYLGGHKLVMELVETGSYGIHFYTRKQFYAKQDKV